MKPNNKKILMILSVLILAILACNAPASVAPAITPQIPTEISAADPVDPPVAESTATSPPPAENPTESLPLDVEESPTPEPTAAIENTATQPPPTATTGPQCVVLQNLNLRAGPGVAYQNPIGFVLEDTVVLPTGYNPVGVPGGSWVLVNDNNKDGWIAAEANFIDCNFDLASLPSVDVEPPPPPPPPGSAQSSNAEGNCGSDSGNPDCDVKVSNDSFIRFKLIENGEELTENDGVEQITFSVRRGGEAGKEVYKTEESTAAYCIFGGNDTCNRWRMEGNEYVWPSGNLVSEGEYFVEILAYYDANTIRWAASFEITLP